MEENNKTMTIAILALLTSLSVGGSTLIDTSSSLDNYYICDINYNTGEFARLSSTLYSAYPNELDNKGYQRCVENGEKGQWHQIVEFAEDNNLDINTLITIEPDNEDIVEEPIQEHPTKPNTATKYICNQYNCSEVIEK